MPVKYGVTLAELFAALGVPWDTLSLDAVQERLDRHNLALTHQPLHFPAAEGLVRTRDLIGKRPPVASLELLWTPHRGERLLISGFVHPPTEQRAWQALRTCGEREVLTIKGLEGSTDLPTTRAGITARLRGEGPLAEALHWNLGCLLWLSDQIDSLPEGLQQARALLLAQAGERTRREMAP